MPEKVQGVNVPNAEDNNWSGDYKVSDVEQIFKDAHPTSWKDMVNYIKTKGDAQWHIKPGEAVAMTEDAGKAEQSGASFPQGDPQKAFQEMHKYRGQDRASEPQVMKQHR